MGHATADPLRDAHDALDRHAWTEALDLFVRADDGSLSGADLEAMAEAAFFSARVDASVDARERAFKAYQSEGNVVKAAALALDLFEQYSNQGKPSIAAAWRRRGERLLDGVPESPAHGRLALIQAFSARSAGDIETALAEAERAVEIGGRTGDADLVAFAMTILGSFRIATGRVADGFELMEEAAVAAVSGELSTFITGVTCCQMIAACRDLSDYGRAREWTEAAEEWCKRESVSGFPGICRVHRAEVVALSGAWERAEEELRRATDELAAYNAVSPMGDGYYAIAEIRLRRGDLEGAEEALRQSNALGHSPQPLLAQIRLAQGDARAALAGINAAVTEQTWDRWARVRLLPTQIEVAVASGDLVLARQGAEELTGLVDAYQSPAMQAGRHEAWGRVLLSEGDAAGAARELRGAVRAWLEVAAPYETARARVLLSGALRDLRLEGEADLEAATALTEFERLGAVPAAAAVRRAIDEAAARRAAPERTRKAFMITDIVESTSFADLLGNDAWEHLLRWHDDTIRAVVARHGGEVVHPTGDGFLLAFDTARQAIEAATTIQRELAAHRRETGFAPAVRVGIHVAEASRHGDDYSGVGVHVAARVAALAGGGEIVVTEETRAEAGGFPASEPRQATVKGVAAPVSVVTIAWS